MFKKIQRHTLFLLLAILFISSQSFAQGVDTTGQAGSEPKATGGVDQALIDKGKTIFEGQCSSCHNFSDEKKVGPGLLGVVGRVPSKDWLRDWIKNSQKLIASKDDYAVKIYNEYDQAQMQSFNFSDEQLDQVIAYLEHGTPEVKTPGGPEKKDGEEVVPQNDTVPGYFTAILAVLVVILILILVVMFFMISVLSRALKQRDDLDEADREVVDQTFNPVKFFQSKAFLRTVALIFFLIIAKAGVDQVIGVGIQQGYAPTQPIPFSHKLHAGNYEIECEYCHTGVRKGKSATIPSANVCMNCHNQVKQGSPNIKKIYKAIEKNQPIQWVRVHNLQDFVYFNHSQHVVAGGLECQECHGEIEKMEVVQQRAPLTMGWCINCHREKVVKAEGNAYYDNLVDTHDSGELKVEDIGGLECSKCHY